MTIFLELTKSKSVFSCYCAIVTGGDAAIAESASAQLTKPVTAVTTPVADLLDHTDPSQLAIDSTGDLPPPSLSDELERGGVAGGSNGEPVFDPTTERNVTVLVGRTALLHCRVRFLGNRTVSNYILSFRNYFIFVNIINSSAPPLLSLSLRSVQ